MGPITILQVHSYYCRVLDNNHNSYSPKQQYIVVCTSQYGCLPQVSCVDNGGQVLEVYYLDICGKTYGSLLQKQLLSSLPERQLEWADMGTHNTVVYATGR